MILADLLPLSFQHVLSLTEVSGHNSGGAIVRYKEIAPAFHRTERGVYVVVENERIVYCGKFTNTFGKRWLYEAHKYIYHHIRDIAALSITNQHQVDVYSQDIETLKQQLGVQDAPWLSRYISATSIEESIIEDISRDSYPIWNKIGKVKRS